MNSAAIFFFVVLIAAARAQFSTTLISAADAGQFAGGNAGYIRAYGVSLHDSIRC